jgi:predicted transcriptional regulator
MAGTTLTAKQQAHELLARLPDDATWDDVVYQMAARRSIERGLADVAAGRVTDLKDVMRELGVPD